MRRPLLWRSSAGPPGPLGPCWLDPADRISEGETGPDGAVFVAPVLRSDSDACAVALVPLIAALQRNGIRARAGLHLLGHADRLELGSLRAWIAVESIPDEAHYDPAVHGVDLLCAALGVRLRTGEPVVICNGPPSRACGLIYKASAWRAGVACACGFRRGAPRWTPTPPTIVSPTASHRRLLDELLLAHGRHRP